MKQQKISQDGVTRAFKEKKNPTQKLSFLFEENEKIAADVRNYHKEEKIDNQFTASPKR